MTLIKASSNGKVATLLNGAYTVTNDSLLPLLIRF